MDYDLLGIIILSVVMRLFGQAPSPWSYHPTRPNFSYTWVYACAELNAM
jgi:TRAP-type C4-dicarboxylate transport system permease small subunit